MRLIKIMAIAFGILGASNVYASAECIYNGDTPADVKFWSFTDEGECNACAQDEAAVNYCKGHGEHFTPICYNETLLILIMVCWDDSPPEPGEY